MNYAPVHLGRDARNLRLEATQLAASVWLLLRERRMPTQQLSPEIKEIFS